MGNIKKRELFQRSKHDEMTDDTVCISDLTQGLIDLQQSLNKLEIQNNKEEGKRAAKICNNLILTAELMKQRIKKVRVDMAVNK